MTDQIKPGDLVERTGESLDGFVQGCKYEVQSVTARGHLVIKDDSGWPYYLFPGNFKRVGSGNDG